MLNDLEVQSGNRAWTWVSGANTVDQYGTYGTSGVGLAGKVPGARTGAVSWTDSAGNLWLFGGQGYAASAFGYLNDLWTFNPGTGIWTWVSGSKLSNQAGTYGAQGKAAIGNAPGGRTSASTWVDSLGNLWLFGGIGVDSASNSVISTDLWEFNPTAGTWTWVAGSATSNGNSNYGQQGIPAASNLPGGRDRRHGLGRFERQFLALRRRRARFVQHFAGWQPRRSMGIQPGDRPMDMDGPLNVAGDPGIYGAPGVGIRGTHRAPARQRLLGSTPAAIYGSWADWASTRRQLRRPRRFVEIHALAARPGAGPGVRDSRPRGIPAVFLRQIIVDGVVVGFIADEDMLHQLDAGRCIERARGDGGPALSLRLPE